MDCQILTKIKYEKSEQSIYVNFPLFIYNDLYFILNFIFHFRKTDSRVAVKRMSNIFDDQIDAKRAYREMHILRFPFFKAIYHCRWDYLLISVFPSVGWLTNWLELYQILSFPIIFFTNFLVICYLICNSLIILFFNTSISFIILVRHLRHPNIINLLDVISPTISRRIEDSGVLNGMYLFINALIKTYLIHKCVKS